MTPLSMAMTPSQIPCKKHEKMGKQHKETQHVEIKQMDPLGHEQSLEHLISAESRFPPQSASSPRSIGSPTCESRALLRPRRREGAERSARAKNSQGNSGLQGGQRDPVADYMM